MKEVVRTCINLVLTGEAPPPRSWLGGLTGFLLKKEDALDTAGYRPVCLLDTVYKCLSAIITDRLYRLSGQPAGPFSGRIPPVALNAEAGAEPALGHPGGGRTGATAVLLLSGLADAFNSLDHQALWRWLNELNVPDIDLLQGLYSAAYYTAELPYG
jgi:hypothetical protein